MGVLFVEKTSLVKRKPVFWYVQGLGIIAIVVTSLYFSLSFWSVICGIVAGYVNMEWLFQAFSSKMLFISLMLKYMIFFLILYVLIKNYLDGISFLVGILSFICCLAGLSIEVIRHDSL